MKKYLVVGNPIEHSQSPKLHNVWLANHNIKAVYDKKKIEKNELPNLVLDIKEKRINGANVTVPFKKSIIPFLDKLTPEATKTQSVNTIYLENDKIIGHNTDIDGFENAIKKIKFDFNRKRIFIIGAGGVVSSIVFALKKMNVSQIIITNRTKAKAIDLKSLFNDLEIIDWGTIPEFDVIINATSIGLKKEDKLNLDLSKTGKNKLFYDVIYNPPETNFLNLGKKFGNKSENGKLMFIYQAVAAFNLWHGTNLVPNNETFKLLDK
tara:strand:+ start:1138 stop:1932 length:795 start_codon:yes stop_codon:yes gene_type:complete